jgi:hypothetical protein
MPLANIILNGSLVKNDSKSKKNKSRREIKSTSNNKKINNIKHKSRVKRRNNHKGSELDSTSSTSSEDETFEVNRINIMSEQILKINGDSTDSDNEESDEESDEESEIMFNNEFSESDKDYKSCNESDFENDLDDLENKDSSDNNSDSSDSDSSDNSSDSDSSDNNSDSDNSSDSNNSINNEIHRKRNDFIKHIEDSINIIKNMEYGDIEEIKADPSYDKCAVVKKNNRFNTFMFSCHGCKNLLKIFMKRTINDPNFGFKRIVQILTNNGYRRFIPINNWEQFWLSYIDEQVCTRRLFEVILSDMPCKPYLDIEWKLDKEYIKLNGPAKKLDFTDFVNKLVQDIIEVFAERYYIDIDKHNVMIASSHSDVKVSFHVVINKIIDGTTVTFHTNLKTEHGSAWDLCKELLKKDKNYINKIDEAVYTTDREFRAIYSNKTNKFRPIQPYAPTKVKLSKNSLIGMDVDECLKYLVTYAKNDMYHLINVPSDNESKPYKNIDPSFFSLTSSKSRYTSKSSTSSKSNNRLGKSSKRCNTVYDDIFKYIPQIYDDNEVNKLLNLVREIHPTAYYTGSNKKNRWRFSYKDKSEKCYSGNYHESNGFFVFKDDQSGKIYMKCLSENCDKSYSLKKGNGKTYSKRMV